MYKSIYTSIIADNNKNPRFKPWAMVVYIIVNNNAWLTLK